MIISNCNRNEWGTAEFWRKICPGLTIGKNDVPVASSRVVQPDEAEFCRQRLIDDGYATIDESLAGSSLINKLLEGVKSLQGDTNKKEKPVKFPASFILLFDETWELARIARKALKQSTHTSNDFNYDILAWYIEEAGGFSPHRDRQPEHVLSSFHEDDMQAKFVTNWIALSNAQPENSCLYVIPKSRDPGYLNGDDGPDATDPMRRALPTKADYQHIRAVPRTPGQSLLFTHRIIHWGSQRDKTSKLPPRVAISFVCSDPSYEKPYIDPKYFTDTAIPPFHIRLLLVCAQLLIYYQRFDLPKESIKACYDYCKEYENELEKSYRQKVYLEFVNAMKEAKKDAFVEGKDLSNNIGEAIAEAPMGKDDNEEDEEDAMMEEMLNAEEQGYGEFQDDYEDTIENADDDNALQDANGKEGDSYDDDDAEGLSLFGNSGSKEPDAKRKKVNVG